MGTRHLIAVQQDNEYKIAQYGQWDGYPSGQGLIVLNFLKDSERINKLRNALAKVRFYDAEGRDKSFIKSYDENSPEWITDQDNRTPEQKRWFSTYISRDLGAEILENVASSTEDEILLRDYIAFAGNSLMCEYAYVIDLDANTFEVYKGLNKSEITEGRFVSGDQSLEKSDGYEPVKLVKTYQISDLPSEKTFISDLDNDDQDEDAA